MPIEWTMGLVGGAIIGLAAAVYLLVNGRIMGASGIIGGLIDGSAREAMSERAAFIAAEIERVTRPCSCASVERLGVWARETGPPVC